MGFFYWTHLLGISNWLIRLVMLPVIVLRKEKPPTCLAWLAIIFFLPWFGLGMYLLLGENRLGRRRLAHRRSRLAEFKSAEYPEVESRHLFGPQPTQSKGELLHWMQQVGGLPPVGGNQVSFMANSDAVIDSLVAEIDAAEHHVHLLFYIFREDSVGQRVGEALVRARGRGVACRVLADAVGSRRMFRRLAPHLRRQQVEVVPALRVNLFRLALARLDLRNHRKLVVIDGKVAMCGSQNIVEATYGHKKAGKWHDVMARITGPAVRQLQAIFLEDWFQETGELLDDPQLAPVSQATGDVALQVLPIGPDFPTEQFQDLIVRAIFLAEHRVVITTPYFVPSEGMLLAMRVAAQRGVQVDLVIPKRSDHPVVDAASSFYCEHLAQCGTNIYLYQQGMLHAKTLTADDEWAMFGSANYDIRSFALNFELNLLLHARNAVADLHALQAEYIAASKRATPDDWLGRTLGGRLKINLAKLFSPLL